MPVLKKPAAAISPGHRSYLRDLEAESACKRPRGPKRKRLTSVSPRQVRRRKALDAKTRTIVIGAGLGRCGTTGLALNLQRQGFAVTHEAGNTHSLDHRSTMKDHFALADQHKAGRHMRAAALVADIASAAEGASVAGDISWVHTQLAEEMLLADKRVEVVFLYRDDVEAWVKSVVAHAPRPRLPETLVFRGAGIDASKGDRAQRLKLYRRFVLAKGQDLKRRYAGRVHVVATERLTAWGKQFIERLGGEEGYDPDAGRNAAGVTRGR